MTPIPTVARHRLLAQIATAVLIAMAGSTLLAEAARASDQKQDERPSLLMLSLAELGQVEVTSVSREASTVAQSPAAVSVITQEDIRRSGATTLPELFRRVPGMDVARIDNNKWAISVRGFTQRFGDKLLVQVDGRTVYNPLFSGVYWDAVDYPLEDIERIEVVRGPGGSVWGANAVNGTINIITKSAERTQGLLVDGGGGSNEPAFGTFRWGGQAGAVAYRVHGKGFARRRQFAQSGDSQDGWQGTSGGGRLDAHVSDRDVVMVQGDYRRSDAGRKDFRPMPSAPFSFTNIETETTHAGSALARWSRRLSADSNWVLQGYWDHAGRTGDRGYVDLRSDTFDVDFLRELSVRGRHNIVYGVGYRDIDAFLGPSAHDAGFAVSFPPPHRNAQLFTTFLQDQIALVPKQLSLTLGTKIEHNDFTGVEYEPTVRALWTPTTRQSMWAAVSRAVRTPNLSEEGIGTRQVPSFPSSLAGAPLFARLRGNPAFQSEQVVAYELGGRMQLADTLSMDAASFYNAYDRLRVVVPQGPVGIGAVSGTFDLPLTFRNGMAGTTYGLELATTWQPSSRWRLYGAYAFLKMDLRADPGVPVSTEIAEQQSPEDQVYLQSSWTLPHRIELDLIGRVVDRLTGFTPMVAAYRAVDAHVSWQVRQDLTLAVTGQNLLDRRHPEFGTAPLLSSLLVEVKRSVYGQLSWTFGSP